MTTSAQHVNAHQLATEFLGAVLHIIEDNEQELVSDAEAFQRICDKVIEFDRRIRHTPRTQPAGLLEPADPDTCDAVTAQLCENGRTALACDDLALAESMFKAIEARVATLQAATR